MSQKLGFRAIVTAVLSLALATTIAAAQGNGHGRRGDEGDGWQDHGRGQGHGRDRYTDHHREIRDWYRAHYSHLPPGLARRDRLPSGLERQLVVNGTLPPGLRRKMQPCPVALARMLPPPPPNYVHVVIGGNLVLYNRANFQIADVFHFELD